MIPLPSSMSLATFNLLNTGIYTIPEAARLTKVSTGRIRRWIMGYNYRKGRSQRHSDAVWHGALKPMDGKIAVGFLDLVEIRFVDFFLRAGVTWATMRKAHAAARHEMAIEHPFCSNKFVTDGRTILIHQASESSDQKLLDIVSNQHEFQEIVRQFLKDLEFTDEQLARWWPLGKSRHVVVDPARNLGQPTGLTSGVPTRILARSIKANSSVDSVARWYEVLPDEVRDAAEFEASLAA